MSWARASHSPGGPWPSSRSYPTPTPPPPGPHPRSRLLAYPGPAHCKEAVLRVLPSPTERSISPDLAAQTGPSVPRPPQRAGWGREVWEGWDPNNDALCPHHCPYCCPVQSAAVAERERVSRLFADAAATLQGFQKEVLGFIEEGEASMLACSQGDLRRQEEQRSRLTRARHNLSQVPEADSVSFLQVRAALRGWGYEQRREKAAEPLGPGRAVLPQLGCAVASRALLGIYLAQELLALRLALEEECGPGPCPPRELSFTKSSQAARAVREVLTAACASQWEQLRGLSSDEDGLQKVSTEGGCPLQVTHCSPVFPHRPWPPGLVPIQDQRMEIMRLVQGGTQILPVTGTTTL